MENEPNNQGLSEQEAISRLNKFGPNELTERTKRRYFQQFVRLFLNPLVFILLTASAISAIVGQPIEALLIIAMVILGLVINFIQTFRSEKAVSQLRQKVAPRATVRRNGVVREIDRRNLVPGDIIELSGGDLVPADAILLTAKDLHVQEAALTGESLPVEKAASATNNTIFLGSSIVSGFGVALITATGLSTQFGHIAKRLMAPPPETEFDRGARHFGLLILKTVFVLVIFVFLANAMVHRNLLESLLFAVALAVGLTPEFLPVISAVTLAKGALKMADSKVIVKHLSAMQNFGSIDILCSDKTGTITSGEMTLDQSLDPSGSENESVFELAYINSTYQSGVHSPLDQSILSAKQIALSNILKLDEIPFDFERRCLSIVVKTPDDNILITKGAPESILNICSSLAIDGREEQLNAANRTKCETVFQNLHAKGLRVLAVASKRLSKSIVTREEECGLTLNGFITFSDPLLPGVGQAIKDLEASGVEIKILTGDNELVAKSIGERIGLLNAPIVLGDQIDQLNDLALEQVSERTKIFARVSPIQKGRILTALKGRNHVVGFMGDGINDAPSLHAADVGISFGNAVDVAKDASDIILLERNLSVLHDGIIEGRKAFGNVMKYLLMGTSSNFGNMFSMAAASLFLPFLPMSPAQILLNNFLYDVAQLSIPTDRVDETFTIKPRHWDITLIKKFMLFLGPLSSVFDFLTFAILIQIFHSSQPEFQTGWFMESLLTQTLVIFSIRTAASAFRSRPSPFLTMTVLSVIALGIAVPYTPISKALGFVPLQVKYFAAVIPLTLFYVAIVELLKSKLMEPQSRSQLH
ncbi:MAG: magnesium-translocating P-type ATPase [Bdellovibrionales bacterium]